MQLSWAIDTDANKYLVLGEELTPLVIEQSAIGLNCPLYPHVRSVVLRFKLGGSLEEVKPHESRLATLPCDRRDRAVLRLQLLPHVLLEDFV